MKSKAEATKEALAESILHWERNAIAASPGGVKVGSSYCALCNMFVRDPVIEDCQGCPVAEYTGRGGCYGSPYYTARNALIHWRNHPSNTNLEERYRDAARAEVNFLKMLQEDMEC